MKKGKWKKGNCPVCLTRPYRHFKMEQRTTKEERTLSRTPSSLSRSSSRTFVDTSPSLPRSNLPRSPSRLSQSLDPPQSPSKTSSSTSNSANSTPIATPRTSLTSLPPQPTAAAASLVPNSTVNLVINSNSIRERNNWRIHLLYVRQNYKDCLKLIDDQLKECNGLCEYPLYIKGIRFNSCLIDHFSNEWWSYLFSTYQTQPRRSSGSSSTLSISSVSQSKESVKS